MAVLSGLKPEKVFEYFEKLCSVPHGSGNTKIISDMCVGFAKELGLRYRQEPCNNVIIWKDGSAGYENAAPIILQGHIDMVCAKTDDCTKDMAVEGLDLRTDGEWVWADKTSLGGDNGIAVAMILAVLSDETLPHPPIEAVFTGDEEVGMDGAFARDCSDLKGKKLLNLDSEIEGHKRHDRACKRYGRLFGHGFRLAGRPFRRRHPSGPCQRQSGDGPRAV